MKILNLNLINYEIPIEKLLLDASNEDNVDNDFSILNINENSSSINTSYLNISDLYNVDSFEKVKQKILKKCNEGNCIYIDTIATNILYNNKWLDLPELIETLTKFEIVIFEIEYSSKSLCKDFDSILEIIKNLNKKLIYNIKSFELVVIARIADLIQNQLREIDFLTEVKIELPIKKIDDHSFSKCFKLKKVKISSSILRL